MYRGRLSSKAYPRISTREAAVFVAESLRLEYRKGRPVAPGLRQAGGDVTGHLPLLALAPPELDAAEYERFNRALDVAGFGGRGAFSTRRGLKGSHHIGALALVMRADARRPRKGPGRQGAPARDLLRTEVRKLLDAIIRRNPECDRLKVAALLVMLHGLDQDGVFWSATRPKGRARVRYIARRLAKLADNGDGQYAERTSRAKKKKSTNTASP